MIILSQEKILHTQRPTLSFLGYNTVYCVKAAFCCLRVESENKEYHHGGFKQQSPQHVVDRYEHMNSRNDR